MEDVVGEIAPSGRDEDNQEEVSLRAFERWTRFNKIITLQAYATRAENESLELDRHVRQWVK